jgi:hypothetical protein
MNTVKFTFNQEYALSSDVFDYYCDYDDEDRHLNVYVDDVDDELINGMNDEDLCEFFGLDSEFLIYTNRQDLL